MKNQRLLQSILCLILVGMLSLRSHAADEEQARTEWMGGFVAMESADKLAKSAPAAALEQYKAALSAFENVRRKYPKWNPSLLNYRVNYCHERIQELTKRLESQSGNREKEELQRLVDQQARELEELKQGNRELKSREEKLTKEVEQARAQATTLSNLEDSLATLNSAKATLEKRNAELELKLKATELRSGKGQDVELYRQEAEEARARVSRLEHELLNARNQASIQETQRLAAERELQTARQAKENLEASLQSTRETADSRQKEIDSLKSGNNNLEARLKEQEGLAMQLWIEIATLRKQLETKQLEINELRYLRLADTRLLDEVEDDANATVSAKEFVRVKQEATVLDEHLKKAQRELSERDEELRQLRVAAARDRAKALNKEEENATLTNENSKLRAQLTHTEERLLALTNQIQELNSKMETIRSEANDTVRKLNDSQAQLGRITELEKRLQEQANLIRAQERQIAENSSGKKEDGKAAEPGTASPRQTPQPKTESPAPGAATPEETSEIKRLNAKIQELNQSLATEKQRRAKLESALIVLEEKANRQQGENHAASQTARAGTPPSPASSQPETANTQETERLSAIQDYLRQGAEAEKSHQLEVAQTNYQKALELDSDNKDALQRLGLIAATLGNDAEAVKNLRMAFKHDPDDVDTLVALGFAQARLRQSTWAIAYLTRAAALAPDNKEIAKYLGAALSTAGWTQAAEQELIRAYNLDKKDADAPFNLAVLYATSNPPDIPNARKWYRIALQNGARQDPGLDQALR